MYVTVYNLFLSLEVERYMRMDTAMVMATGMDTGMDTEMDMGTTKRGTSTMKTDTGETTVNQL